MRPILAHSFALAPFALLGTITPFNSASAQAPRFVDSVFATVNSRRTPGCVVAFDSAGARRWLKSYGQRDLERGGQNDSLTVFEAGSVSKQFAAAAVVLLAQAGKLSLDDDIRKWIPELPDLGKTTVRQMLHHQSGIRDWNDLAEMTRWPTSAATYTFADMLALVSRQRGLNFTPGSSYNYSNTNYALAAVLVERVTGESFRAYTSRAIFTPLGMTHTLWRDARSEVVRNRALPYSPDDSGRYRLDDEIETVVGPGGLLTTMPDLMKWLRGLDTGAIGGRAFVAEMERVGILTSGKATGYAMGLEVTTVGGQRVVSHAGWSGGYVAYAGRVPSKKLALGILCNSSELNTEEIGPAVLARVARLNEAEAPTAPARALGAAATDGPMARVSGTYRSQKTGQPASVKGFANGLSINGVGFAQDRGGQLWSADSSRRVDLIGLADAPPTDLVIVSTSGDSSRYQRLDATLPSSSALDEYVGRYQSAEVDAVIDVRRAGDQLVAWRGGVLSAPLTPLFRDGFRAPSTYWLVEFQRDAAGKLSGFELTLPRTRRVPFTRLP